MANTKKSQEIVPDKINEPTSSGIVAKLYKGLEYFKYLQKDKKNNFHKYTYVSEAQIKARASEMMRELGIIFHLDVTDINVVPLGEGVLYNIKVKYKFVDVETKEELAGESYGAGYDTNDKALYKAITGAIKYIFHSQFLFPSGDDPEDDSKDEAPEPEIYKPAPKAEPKPAPKSEPKPAPKPAPKVKEPQSIEEVVTKELGGKLIADNVIPQDKKEAEVRVKQYLEAVAGSDIETEARLLASSVNMSELKVHWVDIPKDKKERLNTIKELMKVVLS